jgi:selenocysteine lyase/cysteine desulfurase
MGGRFLGDRHVDTVIGVDGVVGSARRVYLDSGATTLMAESIHVDITRYLETACANSHTHAHRAGRATTEAIENARDAVGRLVGYDPHGDSVLFTGNGAPGALNYLARALFPPEIRAFLKAGDERRARDAAAALGARMFARVTNALARPLVVTTVMEHHSNMLPWVEAVGRENCRFVEATPDGQLALDDLARILRADGARVRIVTVAGVSNVTGVRNPVHEIARMAHDVGAEIVVDAAQMAAHAAIALHPAGDEAGALDYVALSGHKMYAPGSRGSLVGGLTRSIGGRCVGDVGGGMVDAVSIDDYVPKDDLTAREEAGTPNIPGTIALGLAARMLSRIGLGAIERHESALTKYALARFAAIPGVRVYGPTWEAHRRAGVIAFNVVGVPHGLVAAYLNDACNIAVRNECFCAHPYVKRLLGVSEVEEKDYLREMAEGERRRVPGMVRASFGLYSTRDDVDRLSAGLAEIVRERGRIAEAYVSGPSGDYERRAGADATRLTPVL